MGSNDKFALLDRLEPAVRNFAPNGFRKPKDVARLLNKASTSTACRAKWTPRLALAPPAVGPDLPFVADQRFQRLAGRDVDHLGGDGVAHGERDLIREGLMPPAHTCENRAEQMIMHSDD